MEKKDRYITLLGDPIHTGRVKTALSSVDLKAAGIAAAFTAAAHDISNSSLEETLITLMNVGLEMLQIRS